MLTKHKSPHKMCVFFF